MTLLRLPDVYQRNEILAAHSGTRCERLSWKNILSTAQYKEVRPSCTPARLVNNRRNSRILPTSASVQLPRNCNLQNIQNGEEDVEVCDCHKVAALQKA